MSIELLFFGQSQSGSIFKRCERLEEILDIGHRIVNVKDRIRQIEMQTTANGF